MQTLSLIWGISAITGMLFGFIPLLGWWNWINIPFSGTGLIIGAIALATSNKEKRNRSIAGIICCVTAMMFGLPRLIIGFGIL